MIKPNWDIFKAKFSENHQNNFEWYCYLLFCNEFNKIFGIFRYKNQSAIETNPVEKDGQFIVWQAKFYDSALSNHKDDIIDMIERAKRDYPEISKIIFYSNQEWGQYRGSEPQGKKDADSKAKELRIELEWRTTSFFESHFVVIDNEIISRHFFSLDKSIVDLIQEQETHSENILYEIQTSILFNEQGIEIDRTDDLIKLKETSAQVIILSGVAGVGKTALIKIYYEQINGEFSLYIFKATEFDISNINLLFTDISFHDFVNAHKDDEKKTIVIDSAEKLIDLRNTDPFKEFLSHLIKNNWKIIFTTRDSYLEDLNYLFFEIYKVAPLNINLHNLDNEELISLALRYDFSLPKDLKLLDLIKSPFYLNKFLNFYQKGEETSYTLFKENLWNNTIRKSIPAREQCFLKIAYERANEGQFFVNPECELAILNNELKSDGILGYESPHGYFITHDIYEEWALEKIIETEFIKKDDNITFFQKIGNSLSVRRSFRKWVSDKLLLQDIDIKAFIENVIDNDKIQSIWKDEILISVLLSDYSEQFFSVFKDELIENDNALLRKLSFLLRIACKEIDDEIFGQLKLKNINIFSLKYALTKPKGHGWNKLIKFVYDNLDKIGIEHIHFLLPIIYDWNNKYKEGVTTRLASLIALRFYEWSMDERIYYSRDETKENLLSTIMYGSSEIKEELKVVFDQVLKNKWKRHSEPYYALSEAVLTKFGGITLCKALPSRVLKLADLFWIYTPRENDRYSDREPGVEQYFGMENEYSRYFPASSFQTPIYWLLQFSLKETVDFILQFTNKVVDIFANSKFAEHEVHDVDVIIDKDKTIKQYICNRLWCLYRGNQAAPQVLESIHMALEKYFLENGKIADSNILERWLLYLLTNSKSASISSVVASIVLAYPDKAFNIAKILFKTKDFFHYDTARMTLDCSARSHYSIGYGLNPENQIHQDERIKTCEDVHRKWTLESLFLQYQVFRSDQTSKEDAENKQKILWDILDDHYKELPDKSKETEGDKTWRLYLARMDRRKMNIETEDKDGQTYISFNPEIEPELKDFSEKSLKRSNAPYKHMNLFLWSHYKYENNEDYKQYEDFENDPKLALQEVISIEKNLAKIEKPEDFKFDHTEDENYFFTNYSTPAYACAVLLEHHSRDLSVTDKEYCKNIILQYAQSALMPDYRYQVSDGTQPAITTLPSLFHDYPDERNNIKNIILQNLFNDYPINAGGNAFNEFAIMAVKQLWDNHFDDAQSLLLGYLILKQSHKNLIERIRKENQKKRIYDFDMKEVGTIFDNENKEIFDKVLNNKLSIEDLGDFEKYDLSVLRTAFMIIPTGKAQTKHKELVIKFIQVFCKQLLSREREDKVDYKVRHDFLRKLAFYILNTKKQDIHEYLKPFFDNFNGSEAVAELFNEFVSAEDRLNAYDNFWVVWDFFKDKIINLCKNGDGYWYVDRIIRSYLFAQAPWKETAKEWHTLKDENKRFFKIMSEQIGHCPSALYAISKLLNDIGSPYLNDGVQWISNMLKNNQELYTKELVTNTIYYIENLARKYIYKNRENIRRTRQLKQEVIIILDFLIEKASVVGYLLRESIL
jgi:hypothetical protein